MESKENIEKSGTSQNKRVQLQAGDKFVKLRQYKNFGYIAGGIVFVFIIMMVFRESNRSDKLSSSRHYKKEIRTGVDGLSEQELWVEKSTNEIEEIRNSNKKIEDQNGVLKKQLDSIQKMVIGLGVRMRAFDGQSADALPEVLSESDSVSSSNEVPSDNDNSLSEISNSSALDRLESFSNQRGIVESNMPSSGSDIGLQKSLGVPEKVLKNGFKVIKFNNADNEYDLDENFIFAGTYARAILVGTVIASAGIGASSNPEPVMLRINDTGNLPNNVKGFLKDAIVIGAAYGDLSSESVVIRLERIVKIDKKTGVGVDIPVKGYVAGENGCSKIRGMVFDRAGKVARNAAVAGFLSGMADYLSVNNSNGIKFEPNSGLAQFSPQAGSKMLQQGASKGIGNAVEKYADFIIKRAEQMQPVIMIDGGRKVTIVFTDSVKASSVHMKKVRKKLYVKRQF